MIEQIKQWIRSYFWTKKELADQGALDSRYYTETEITAALALYALLGGRAGGQTLKGGTAASENLTLQSTAHATRGKIVVGTSAYDEVNNRLGIKTASPSRAVQAAGTVYVSATDASFTTSNWAKAVELLNASAIQWLKGAGTISRAIGFTSDDNLYILRSTADDNSAAATYDFIMDGSGNVGIGKTPALKLDVNGTAQCTQAGESWSALTLNTGGNWANYGGAFATASYKKFGDIVMVRGLVKRTAGVNTSIATLPSGYRPASYEVFSVIGDGAVARVDAQSDGVINLAGGTAATYLSINMIFSTA